MIGAGGSVQSPSRRPKYHRDPWISALPTPGSPLVARVRHARPMDIEPLEPLPEDWERRPVRRGPPRRHGVRRRRRRRPLDRAGQARRLLHGHQRRGRHRRDGRRTSAAGSGRPSRSSPPGSSASTPSTSSACPTASWSTAYRCGRAIAEVVRRHRPDIVITGNFRDTWGGRNLNQADHIAVGRAVLDAVRDAGNRWVFPEQLDRRPRAVGRGREVWAFGSPNSPRTPSTPPTPSTPAWPRSRRTRAYIDGPRLGELRRRASSSRAFGRQTGQRLGVGMAAAFEVFPMGWGE